MSKTYTVTVFNTITLQYEEINVTRAVYNEFRRGKWRISTINGVDGADWTLMHESKLPNYYITREEAKSKGWNSKFGNLKTKYPNKMISGGVYYNDNGHLPMKNGRIWYEVDINYKGGYRNTQRLVYSNDGLIFVSYDYYRTFFEII